MFAGRLQEDVLEDRSVLHDHDEVLLVVLQHVDVGCWIALDEQEIGERPFLDHAKLRLFVRIAFADGGEVIISLPPTNSHFSQSFYTFLQVST